MQPTCWCLSNQYLFVIWVYFRSRPTLNYLYLWIHRSVGMWGDNGNDQNTYLKRIWNPVSRFHPARRTYERMSLELGQTVIKIEYNRISSKSNRMEVSMPLPTRYVVTIAVIRGEHYQGTMVSIYFCPKAATLVCTTGELVFRISEKCDSLAVPTLWEYREIALPLMKFKKQHRVFPFELMDPDEVLYGAFDVIKMKSI